MRSTVNPTRLRAGEATIGVVATLALIVLAIVGNSAASALFATLGIALLFRSLEPLVAHTGRERVW
jgi:hypothetical protein